MLISFLFIFYTNKSNIINKVFYTLFWKEQFDHLKTTHSYHLVDPSPWRAAEKCVRPFLLKRLI